MEALEYSHRTVQELADSREKLLDVVVHDIMVQPFNAHTDTGVVYHLPTCFHCLWKKNGI